MENQSKTPEFSVVEIEVNSSCNRKCSYCPVSILPPPNTPEYMEMRLFHKIMNELRDLNYCGLLSYHLYNEPLLRKDLTQLVKIARRKVPKAFQLLFTNGDLLNDLRYRSLLDAGINHFIVTRHSGTPIKSRENQTILYPKDLIIVNRGGLLENISSYIEKDVYMPCYAPTDKLIITSSGDVLLCCDDAERKEVMGNIMTEFIREIWFNITFEEKRYLLRQGRRAQASKICENCNNLEYTRHGINENTHFLTERNNKTYKLR